MDVIILPDRDEAACRAAQLIAERIRDGVALCGRFVLALSGGQTAPRMLAALAEERVPWRNVHVVQVDERIAPAGDPDRNFTQLQAALLERVALDPACVHAMPVERVDLSAAALNYAVTLGLIAGRPPVLDLVHLGLGSDGHTASLVPGDAVLDIADADVAVTGAYQGRQRMTLTLPTLRRARFVVWLVTGAEKGPALARLRRGDPGIPAGRVRAASGVIVADRAAAGTS